MLDKIKNIETTAFIFCFSFVGGCALANYLCSIFGEIGDLIVGVGVVVLLTLTPFILDDEEDI